MVGVAGDRVAFARAETIWTESSYKYDEARLARLVSEGGFEVARLWTDAGARFWVAFLVTPCGAGEPAVVPRDDSTHASGDPHDAE